MIRVTIELVPTGINELAQVGDRITIGCKFPLNSESQELMFFSERDKRYAEIKDYNLNETLYAPADGKPHFLEIVYRAIGELLSQNTFREGGEFYPGMYALEPEEFDKKIAEIMEEHKGDIQSIRLFGKRVNEVIDYPAFYENLMSHAVQTTTPALPDVSSFSKTPEFAGRIKSLVVKHAVNLVDGDYLMRTWPAYIPYDLAIKLDPQVYRTWKTLTLGGRKFTSKGEFMEAFIQSHYCTRPNPNMPDTLCFNGLLMYFIRPDGKVTIPLGGVNISKRERGKFSMGEFDHDYSLDELKAEIKAGNLIYSKREGLQKYPGIGGL